MNNSFFSVTYFSVDEMTAPDVITTTNYERAFEHYLFFVQSGYSASLAHVVLSGENSEVEIIEQT